MCERDDCWISIESPAAQTHFCVRAVSNLQNSISNESASVHCLLIGHFGNLHACSTYSFVRTTIWIVFFRIFERHFDFVLHCIEGKWYVHISPSRLTEKSCVGIFRSNSIAQQRTEEGLHSLQRGSGWSPVACGRMKSTNHPKGCQSHASFRKQHG